MPLHHFKKGLLALSIAVAYGSLALAQSTLDPKPGKEKTPT